MSKLPKQVIGMIMSVNYLQFATVSRSGVPIDTPANSFPKEDLSTIDLATGVAYPAKAERLRHNPKAGLWIDGVLPGEPTISIAGFGATLDSDIQANALRYIEETGSYGAALSAEWSAQFRSIWYWARIIMCIAPLEIVWWDHGDDLESKPHRWEAPADTLWPRSDPIPPGEPSRAAKWPQPVWTALAENAFRRKAPGHFCVMDANGFPRPMKARNIEQTAEGFIMDVPTFAPGMRSGPASLSFQGSENFVGTAAQDGTQVRLRVDHVLPLLPLMNDPKELWNPKLATYEVLIKRLEAELARRGQLLPIIPQIKPAPTVGAKLRGDRLQRIAAQGQLPPRWGVPIGSGS